MTLIEMLNRTEKRRDSFNIMINHLKTINNPLILETGCARLEDNFIGDGMSTLIFDEYVDQFGGEFYSVDINPENINFTRTKVKKANLHCEDSVISLYKQSKVWQSQNRKIDLLYLDSFDFDESNPHPSSLHHIFELVSIMPSLKEGTMICVDDNFMNVGKGEYVKQYMDLLGKDRIYTGYQWIWIL